MLLFSAEFHTLPARSPVAGLFQSLYVPDSEDCNTFVALSYAVTRADQSYETLQLVKITDSDHAVPESGIQLHCSCVTYITFVGRRETNYLGYTPPAIRENKMP